MRFKLVAIVTVAVLAAALAGAGYFAVTQYRQSRVDVIAELSDAPYFYDSVPLASLATLPPPQADELPAQLRDVANSAAAGFGITGEFFAVEDSGEWNRVAKVAAGNFRPYGFIRVASTSKEVGGVTADCDLFEARGAVRRIFDKRRMVVAGIPLDSGQREQRYALGFFELSPDR